MRVKVKDTFGEWCLSWSTRPRISDGPRRVRSVIFVSSVHTWPECRWIG